jgi:cysteine desulfurase family protein
MEVNYLDNAASSWPKPPQVMEAMMTYIRDNGANPGRGSHKMAVDASRALFEGRKQLGRLFGIKNPNDISYSLNTTEALNLAIKGFLQDGDHVICTAVEHNSVRRPLEYLRKNKGIEISYVKTDVHGNISIKDLQKAILKNTRLVVCNHSSNLLGSILPIGEIGELTRSMGIRLLVDAAQSAGVIPIDVNAMGIDMLAFPGHKSLLGPQGTGGIYIHSDIDLEPTMHGGTGSQSEAIDQPTVRPDRYEAGTQNAVGIVGLTAGVRIILNDTVQKIHTKEWNFTQHIMEGLQAIKGVQILGPKLGEARTGIVSFTMQGLDSSEVAFQLDRNYNIAVRAGYHCTPLAHEMAGTLGHGAVRASVGYYNTLSQVEQFVRAIQEIANNRE